MATVLVHATTVAMGNRAVLLRGASGSGKSDLALRFLADQSSFPSAGDARWLVADDQTHLSGSEGQVFAAPPASLAGLIEVRGVGLVTLPFKAHVPVVLVVDLVSAADVDRMPADDEAIDLLGCRIPLRRLMPFEASAPLKLVLLLNLAT